MSHIELYSFFRSTATWRVRIALNLKKVPHALKLVWVRGNAHETPDYLAVNPHGLVPAMKVGNKRFGQSIAMLEYLEETYPDPPLLPEDPLSRANVRAASLLVACDIHPLNNRRVLMYLKHELNLSAEQVSAWEYQWVAAGYKALDAQCAESSGRFLFGDDMTMADVCLVPQVENGKRAGVDIAAYPRLHRAYRSLVELPEFRDAHPDNQPDNPDRLDHS